MFTASVQFNKEETITTSNKELTPQQMKALIKKLQKENAHDINTIEWKSCNTVKYVTLNEEHHSIRLYHQTKRERERENEQLKNEQMEQLVNNDVIFGREWRSICSYLISN
eukprot:388278_1